MDTERSGDFARRSQSAGQHLSDEMPATADPALRALRKMRATVAAQVS